jgi:hypothetical protein
MTVPRQPREFESSAEAVAWADQWVAPLVPSALALDLAEGERDHFRRFNTEYGRFVVQTEAEIACLAELIDQLNFVDRSTETRTPTTCAC